MTTITRLPWTGGTAVRRNLILDPSHESATIGRYAAFASSTLANVVAAGEGFTAPSGARVLKVATTAAFGGVTLNVNASSLGAETTTALVAHNVSVSARFTAGAAYRYRVAEYRPDAVGGILSASGYVNRVAVGGWERLATAHTPTQTGTILRLEILLDLAGTFYTDAWLLERQAPVAAHGVIGYYDGAYPIPSPRYRVAWAGAANGSASILYLVGAADEVAPLLTLAPYTAAREAGTIVHRLLDDSQARFTWRQPNLPTGVFEFLFGSHGSAYAALSKLSARTAWVLVDEADDGPIERWFMVAGGDLEMEQSREVENAYVVRVPYVEVDSL